MYVGGIEIPGYPDFDPYHLLVGIVPYAADQTRNAARNDSYSYRDFKVGATVFGFNPNTQATGLLNAGNLKRTKHKTKICAERKALNQAKKAGYTEVAGLIVAGTTDLDLIKEVTNEETPTLHPCDECRHYFDTHALMRDETLIITVGLEEDKYQVHSHGEMKNIYKSKVEPGEQRVVYGFDNWEQRTATYDMLAIAEQVLPPEDRRPLASLAQMALLTDLA